MKNVSNAVSTTVDMSVPGWLHVKFARHEFRRTGTCMKKHVSRNWRGIVQTSCHFIQGIFPDRPSQVQKSCQSIIGGPWQGREDGPGVMDWPAFTARHHGIDGADCPGFEGWEACREDYAIWSSQYQQFSVQASHCQASFSRRTLQIEGA